MDLIPWIPSITTTGLFAAALWLGRKIISTRLAKSVEHEFNEKLESVRSQMRESEERLKADLRAKEGEITALQSGALSALASRQMAVDKRRLEAVDQLWSSVMSLEEARVMAKHMPIKEVEKGVPLTELESIDWQRYEILANSFDYTKIDFSGALKARPFLTPTVWAVYSAIQTLLLFAAMRKHMVKIESEIVTLMKFDDIFEIAKVALPDFKLGPSNFYSLIEALDAKLLREIQLMLSGLESDKASIEMAAEILKRVNDISTLAAKTDNRE